MNKKTLYNCLFVLSTFFILNTTLKAQSVATTTINYTGFLGCGGCAVCGGDYYCYNTVSSYCGNTAACNTKTFTNPVPSGNIVTAVQVNYFSANCQGNSLTASINGNGIPTVNEGNSGCACSTAPCGQSASSSNTFPCGLPGYNNIAGSTNTLQLCTGAAVCINRLQLVFTYAPANQASPALQPSAIIGNSQACEGASQNFSVLAVSNAATYTWTAPAGWTINTGQGTNIITATPGSGASSGNVCVTAGNLCGNSAPTCFSVNVITNSIPPTGVTANPSTICNGQSSVLNFTGGALGTGANWNWYSGSCSGTFLGSGTTLTVNPTTNTTYFVNASGVCNTTPCQSVMVTVNPIPVANAGVSAIINCTNSPISLSGSGGTTFSWFGPSIVSGSNTANPTVDQPGTYSLIVTDNGCTSSVSTVVITQNTIAPTVTLSASSSNTFLTCYTGSTVVSYSANVIANSSSINYMWASSTSNSSVASYTAPGVYTFTATDNNNGCSTAAQFTVSGNITSPPSLNTTLSTYTILCGQTASTLQASTSSTNSIYYTWVSPTSTLISMGLNTNTAATSEPGTHTVIATDSLNGCSSFATTNVVNETVIAQFAANPLVGTVPVSVTFTNQSLYANSYQWSFGNGTSSTATNPINVDYLVGGTYTVTLIGNSNTCSDTAIVVLVFEDSFSIEIPNVFTPNGDNSNDVFYIKSKGVKEFDLQIFNRWGEKIFQYSGPKAEWDGNTISGAKVPDGTYYFFLKVSGFDGTELEKQGTVNLFR